MTDPLSITASVIAVANLAYASSKILYKTISSINNPPENLRHLKDDIENLYKTIDHLIQLLAKVERNDATLSEAQKSNLHEIKPSLTACRTACDAFKAKIDQLLCHSMDGRISLRDKIKTYFQENEISSFQARLESYKLTFAIAVEFSSFKITTENLDATKNLESKIEDITARLTGQMQGLQIGLQAVLHAVSGGDGLYLTKAQQSEILAAIDKQNISLGQCYRACMVALEETIKVTGHKYKHMKASKEAKLLMGDLGNVQGAALHSFSNIEVEGGWVVAGNMAGDSAKDFFK